MLRKLKFLFLFPHQPLPIYEDWKITTLQQRATSGRITQPRCIQESPVYNLPTLASPAHLSYQNRNYSDSISNGKKLFNPMVNTLYYPFSFSECSFSIYPSLQPWLLLLCILTPSTIFWLWSLILLQNRHVLEFLPFFFSFFLFL